MLYNRSGVVDIPGQTAKVVDDLDVARGWRKGKIDESAIKRPHTEAGFKE